MNLTNRFVNKLLKELQAQIKNSAEKCCTIICKDVTEHKITVMEHKRLIEHSAFIQKSYDNFIEEINKNG